MSSTQPGKKATEHTCLKPGQRSPAFGRKTPGCPRCDELLGGAAPRDRFTKAEPAPGTKHSPQCSPPGRGPGFRRTPGCPRCGELLAGDQPREAHAGIDTIRRRAETDADLDRRIREHDCVANRCGRVCTAFDW